MEISERLCNKCGGSGTLFNPELTASSSPCWQCGGTGYRTVTAYVCIGCIEKEQRIDKLKAENEKLRQELGQWLTAEAKLRAVGELPKEKGIDGREWISADKLEALLKGAKKQ